MTGAEINHLFERLGRLVSASNERAGDGTAWDYTFPNGETHRYVIRGLKSHAEVEDSAANLLIWIWSAKDYLKRRAETLGKKGQEVEVAVNRDHYLLVCADLANRLKHGGLNITRSGAWPKLGKASFVAPQAAIGSLTLRAFEVEIQIANPSEVEFSLPVIDDAGTEIGDAFDFAAQGVKALEGIREYIEQAI